MGCCESTEDPEKRHLLSKHGDIQANDFYFNNEFANDRYTIRFSNPWNFVHDQAPPIHHQPNTVETLIQQEYDKIVKNTTHDFIDISQGDEIINQRYQENPFIKRLYVDALQNIRFVIPKIYTLPIDRESLDDRNPCSKESLQMVSKQAESLHGAIDTIKVQGDHQILGYFSH